MVRFVWQKLIHKKWLNMCTFIGIVLLISVTSGHVLYQGAALNKLLQNKFDIYIGDENAYPAVIEASYNLNYQKGSGEASEQADGLCRKVKDNINRQIPLDEEESMMLLASDSLLGIPYYKRDNDKQDLFFIPTYMENMEYHIALLKGEIFNEAADKEGIYECIINEKMLYTCNLSVGEVITFPKTEMNDQKELKIRISGIFKESDSHDPYWVRYPNSYEKSIFMSEKSLNEIMSRRAAENINMNLTYNILLDYEKMTYKQVKRVKSGIEELIAKPPAAKMIITSALPEILAGYQEGESQVRATMQTLQVPLLVLLLAFLYMVSSHIFEMEQNEIAMLKSRGVSNFQVVGIYLMQSLLWQ